MRIRLLVLTTWLLLALSTVVAAGCASAATPTPSPSPTPEGRTSGLTGGHLVVLAVLVAFGVLVTQWSRRPRKRRRPPPED